MTSPAPYPRFDGTQMCTQTDPEVWFPPTGGDSRPAKELCRDCEWQRPCLAYALTHTELGIWGGTSGRERRALQRQYGIQPATPILSNTPHHLTEEIPA